MKYVCLILIVACAVPFLGIGHDASATLDPALERAVNEAKVDAALDGIALEITSGVRTREHQRKLLDDAIATYGSEEVARRYVAPPDRSSHVTGKAVDIGPTDAAYWLAQHGARYGLCQIYANEIWHYERVIEPGGTCPEQLRDAAARR